MSIAHIDAYKRFEDNRIWISIVDIRMSTVDVYNKL